MDVDIIKFENAGAGLLLLLSNALLLVLELLLILLRLLKRLLFVSF